MVMLVRRSKLQNPSNNQGHDDSYRSPASLPRKDRTTAILLHFLLELLSVLWCLRHLSSTLETHGFSFCGLCTGHAKASVVDRLPMTTTKLLISLQHPFFAFHCAPPLGSNSEFAYEAILGFARGSPGGRTLSKQRFLSTREREDSSACFGKPFSAHSPH